MYAFEAVFFAILIGVASYRFWRFLAVDTVTLPLRARLFFKKPDAGSTVRTEIRDIPGWRSFSYMYHCPWCLGSWIAIATTVITDLVLDDDGLPAPILIAAAAAVLTGMLGANDNENWN